MAVEVPQTWVQRTPAASVALRERSTWQMATQPPRSASWSADQGRLNWQVVRGSPLCVAVKRSGSLWRCRRPGFSELRRRAWRCESGRKSFNRDPEEFAGGRLWRCRRPGSSELRRRAWTGSANSGGERGVAVDMANGYPQPPRSASWSADQGRLNWQVVRGSPLCVAVKRSGSLWRCRRPGFSELRRRA